MTKVTIYTTNVCPYCDMAKKWLKENKISFTEKNVQEDRTAAEEMINKSGQTGVPVIDVDGNIVIGYNKKELERLLIKK